MAVRQIAVTDTLEKFRTEFNLLNSQDFGDIANLSSQISATNIVEAMNETISIATSTAGWTMEDSSSTQQIVGGGDVARFLGASNQINVVVSAPDTATFSLNSNIEVTTSVKAGTLTIAAGSITDTSGSISLADENLTTSGNIQAGTLKANNIAPASGTNVDFGSNNIVTSGFFYTSNASGGLIFEGATADAFETIVTNEDPTADRTITLPNNSGTVITTGSTDAVVETMMANDAIGQAELKTVVELKILNSSGTELKTLYGAGA